MQCITRIYEVSLVEISFKPFYIFQLTLLQTAVCEKHGILYSLVERLLLLLLLLHTQGTSLVGRLLGDSGEKGNMRCAGT